MLIFYIRHGDPNYDTDSLTPLGARQAESAAHRLAQFGIDEIYTSPLNRAKRTAQPLCEMLGKEPRLLEWADEEECYRDLSRIGEDGKRHWMLHIPVYRDLFLSRRIAEKSFEWYEDPAFLPSCETRMKIIADGADEWLASLGYRHDRERGGFAAENPNDRRIAVFSHEGVGKVFLAHILEIPYPSFAMHFEFGHTGITVVEFANRAGLIAPEILTHANDSHLFRDGLPLLYQNRVRF